MLQLSNGNTVRGDGFVGLSLFFDSGFWWFRHSLVASIDCFVVVDVSFSLSIVWS